MKLNKKGFSTIELLACFIIVIAIVLSMFSVVMNYRNKQSIKALENDIKTYQVSMTEMIQDSLISNNAVDGEKIDENNIKIIYEDNSENILKIDTENKVITFDGINYPSPNIKNLNLNHSFEIIEENERKYIEISIEISHPDIKNAYKIDIFSPFYIPHDSTPSKCFAFSSGTITDYLCYPKNTAGLPEITDVIIPKAINGVNVTVIGANSFKEKGLTTVYMPQTITIIEEYAFYNNKNLTAVDFSNNITSIAQYAFYDNDLSSVLLPNELKTIATYSFTSNSLTSLKIPEKVTTIGKYSFNNNKITSLIIPSSVTTIEGGAFNNNQLPDASAFIYARTSTGAENKATLVSYGGSKRSGVVIPSSVKTIGHVSFNSTSLTSVTIPSSVTKIESYAFRWNSLTSIKLPTNLTTIETYAFSENKLTNIEIPAKVTTMGAKAFEKSSRSNSGLTKIHNKTNKSFNFGNITGGSGAFASGIVTHANGNITVTKDSVPILVNGETFNEYIPSSATTITFTDTTAPTGVTITDLSDKADGSVAGWLSGTTYYISSQQSGVNVIANADCANMFRDNTKIKTVNFTKFDTSNVTDMYRLFAGCKSLTTVTFGSGWNTSKVEYLYGVFRECSSLTTVDLTKFSLTNVNDMSYMFANCTKLKSITLGTNWNTSNVEWMEGMFYNCPNLTLNCSSWNVKNVTEYTDFKYGSSKVTAPKWVN